MPDMNPEAAAQAMDADSTDEMAGDAFDGSSPSQGPMSRLFDGNASGPPVSELEMDYGLPKWGSLIGRGILRTASGDGVPPAFEIAMGAVLGFLSMQNGEGGGEPSNADDVQVGA